MNNHNYIGELSVTVLTNKNKKIIKYKYFLFLIFADALFIQIKGK